jgi:hypothetical protein
MTLFVNEKLLGVIAFIMVFTYIAEFVVFASANTVDYDSEDSIIKQQEKMILKENVLSFPSWLRIHWYICYYTLNGPTNTANNYKSQYADIYDSSAVDAIKNDCPWNHPINDGCMCAVFYWGLDEYMTWFNTLTDFDYPYEGNGIGLLTQTKLRDELYPKYLKKIGWAEDDGELVPYQKNLLESALDFLGQIPDGIAKFVDLMAFNIKDKYGEQIIPDGVKTLLLCFFIPMQIILFIEIIPILSKIIEAIGSLIPF